MRASPSAHAALKTTALVCKVHPFAVTEDQFFSCRVSGDVFQDNLSALFSEYNSNLYANRYAQFLKEKEHEDVVAFSHEAFVKIHGEPPWVLINDILVDGELGIEVTSPSTGLRIPFTAMIKKQGVHGEIGVSALSSGEKLFLAFAQVLYASRRGDGVGAYPKLLLLDEIDAPLHPRMTRSLISALTETLVRKRGVKVVLATHSPSTVALAPEESIYRISGQPRKVVKVSRDEAIQTLTDGFVVVTPASRFVITEAKMDRMFYGALANALVTKRELAGDPSLVFIQATDARNKAGGGADQVGQWSKKLAKAGLPSIFGLVDRDVDRKRTGHLHVIGRYSIENYLLDPLLLYAVAMKEGFEKKIYDIGFADKDFTRLTQLRDTEVQAIADAITLLVETKNPNLRTSKTFDVEYLSKQKLTLPLWYRDTRGHDLESLFRAALNPLTKKGHLISPGLPETVDMLTVRLASLIPVDLRDVFVAIQNG